MKKKILATLLAIFMVLPFALTACNTSDGGQSTGGSSDSGTTNDAKDWYLTYQEKELPGGEYDTQSTQGYNKNLYFLNELKFKIADPSVIYIETGKEKGYFYAYGTSDLIAGYGIQCWRSKDLTNWEYVSAAYHPDFENCWASRNHWAPEVIYDKELDGYLMFYNADYVAGDIYTNPDQWSEKGSNSKSISLVFSNQPYGPFEPITDELKLKPAYDFSPRNSVIEKSMQRSNTIDAHPFVDPVSGEYYLYWSGYGYDGFGNWHGQTIFGVKMNDRNWLDPDYSTVTELTHYRRVSVDSAYDDISEEQGVNEAPFVWYEDGQYYLTFSTFNFMSPMYQVRQALADSPLGKFVKVQPADGGQVIVTEPSWSGTVASAGHHCFIKCGEHLMIAYHTFKDRESYSGDQRALAVDTISFVTNKNGQKLLHANGPTYAYQPLPEEISGYKNLAQQATIETNNAQSKESVKNLTDGTLKVHTNDCVEEYVTTGGKTTIKFSFDEYVDLRSVMVYNSFDYDYSYTEVSSISLDCYAGNNKTVKKTTSTIPFNFNWYANIFEQFIYPGVSTIAEFNDIPVKSLTITINASDPIAINEIVILGKKSVNPQPVKELGSYSYTNPTEVSPLPVYESQTFGSAGNGYYKSDYGFDLSHDDGTENAYIERTWAGNTQNLYFKDVETNAFFLEVDISVLNHTKSFDNDPYPKAGIMMRTRNKYFVSYNIDFTSSFNNPYVGIVESNTAGTNYYWNNYRTFYVEGLKYTGNNYAKLGIARVDKNVYLFADNKFIAKIDNLTGFSADASTACSIGFISFNCYTRYKNYRLTTSRSDVVNKLTSYGISI